MQSIIPSIIQHTPSGQSTKQYQMGQFLGKGGFAKCYQATELIQKQQVAIKVVNKMGLQKNRAKQKLLLEIKIHRNLNHPHIVKFDNVFEDKNNVYIVMELCGCRTLNQMVKKRKFLTPPEVRFYMLQLLAAVQYLHSLKIIHRDLKMGNIFLSNDMQLKLGDFGLSAKLEYTEERKRTMAGTPNYIAPQIIDGNGGHSYEVDIWSTGVICYAMLFGRPPFQSSDIKMTYNRIKQCQYNIPSFPNVPEHAKDFIKKTLVLDPKKRMTIKEMLEHPFLCQNVPHSIPHTALIGPPVFQFNGQNLHKKQKNKFKTSNQTHNALQKPISEKNIVDIKSQNTKQNNPYVDVPHQNPPLNQLKVFHNNQQLQKQSQLTNGTSVKQNHSKITIKQENPHQNQYFSISVKTHVDYSVKYGMGYELTDGSMGVFFNDSTILCHDSNKGKYFYFEDPGHSNKHTVFNVWDFPQQRNFTKKKYLLQKIQAHLKENNKKNDVQLIKDIKSQHNLPQQNNSQLPKSIKTTKNLKQKDQHKNKQQQVYVKQWLKTKHAVMFRLSNSIFQVDFFDHSQILLHTEERIIKFTSKKGVKQFLLLSQVGNYSETELGRRIKYTKDILHSLKKDNGSDKSINRRQRQGQK